MDQLREAVEKTIRYGGRFGSEYGYKEITERLISGKIYADEEIKAKLQEIKRPDVKNHDNAVLKSKIDKAEILGKKLAKNFKNILLVGITGSAAAGYPKENEDIDLMIITKKDSLWIIRLEVKIWTLINKIPQRGYGGKPKKDEFCFNLWLEEESLKLPVNRQNLRNAMDLILMKPVADKNKTYERFIKENEWVKKYMATGYSKKVSNGTKLSSLRAGFNIRSVVNRVVFGLQYRYMRRKITAETVDLKKAFFHPESGK